MLMKNGPNKIRKAHFNGIENKEKRAQIWENLFSAEIKVDTT